MTRICFLIVMSIALIAALVPSVGCGTQMSTAAPSSAVDREVSIGVATASHLYPARQGDKWGFIDETGKVIIAFQYEEAKDFSDHLAAVMIRGQWGYIDESGGVVVTPRFEHATSFHDGRALVYSDAGPLGFIDKSGKVVIDSDPSWVGVTLFSEGLSGITLEDGSIFIDQLGDSVLQLKDVASVAGFSQGLAGAEKQGLYGYIDRTGQFVIEPQFYSVWPFSNDLAVVERELGSYELIDRTGQVVKDLDYGSVGRMSEGRARVTDRGLMGVMAQPPGNASNGARAGYITASGQLIVPYEFKEAQDFHDGLAQVIDPNGKMGYIDVSGRYVWREQ